MTPSFIGLMATMFPGVRPSMSFASLPTASTRPFTLLMATIDGSLTTMPFPRAETQVLAVPRSMARSLENSESIERRLKRTPVMAENQRARAHGSIECSFEQSRRPVAKRFPRRYASVIGRSDGGHDTVLAGFFDLIHRFVGGLHELFRRGGDIGQRGHAH